MDDLSTVAGVLADKDREINDLITKITDIEQCITFNTNINQERDLIIRNCRKMLEDTRQKIKDENTCILRKEAEIENIEQIIENQKELFQRQLVEEDRLQKEKFDVQKLIQSKLIYESHKRDEIEQQRVQKLLMEKNNFIKRRDDAIFKISKAQEAIQTYKESNDIRISQDRNTNSLSVATLRFKNQQVQSQNETLEKQLCLMKKNQERELNKLVLHIENIKNQKDEVARTKVGAYLTTIKQLKEILQSRMENRKILMLNEMEHRENNNMINDEIHQINNSTVKNDRETKKIWYDWERNQRKVEHDRKKTDIEYSSCLKEGKALQKKVIEYFETTMKNDRHWIKVRKRYNKYCNEKKSALDETQKRTSDMEEHLKKTEKQLEDIWNSIPIMQLRIDPEQERVNRKTQKLKEVKDEYDALKKQALDLKGEIVKLQAMYNIESVQKCTDNKGIISSQIMIRPGTNTLRRDELVNSIERLSKDIEAKKSQIHALRESVRKLNKKKTKLRDACVFITKLAGVPHDKLHGLLCHVAEQKEK